MRLIHIVACNVNLKNKCQDFFVSKDGFIQNSRGGGRAEGEADSSLSRELYVGLRPGTLGSRPELKADAQLTKPPRGPGLCSLLFLFLFFKSHEIILHGYVTNLLCG